VLQPKHTDGSKFKEAGVMIKMDDVAAGIAKSKEEKDNVEKGLN
jgi:hypothetical protein